MKNSSLIEKNGVPFIKVGDEELAAVAYITYFDERNEYEKFSKLGYRIYSVSVSTASRAINTSSGFMPFLGGIFDEKGKPDFLFLDRSIRAITDVCPNACIFPRIYLCMPEWWCKENPDECVMTPKDGMREALYSEKFKKDCGEMLKEIIRYINEQDYSENIIGYQLSGGNTQEWFHLDNREGSFADVALPYFNNYLKENRPDLAPLSKMPERIFENGFAKDIYMQEYIDFANDCVADTVEYFCKLAKEKTNFKQLVGAFYGYTLEVSNPVEGTHALYKLLDSKHIDFFSSPNSYVQSRPLGIDWGDMMPVSSVRLHGKFCFIECDIRTQLSLSPGESRKGSDPHNYYTSAVWRGPATDELSVMAMRKCYAHQLTHHHAFWWFDMFGHWYDTKALLTEAERSLRLAELHQKRGLDFDTELAVFVDERAYKHVARSGKEARAIYNLRTSLGASGIPYHVYLIEDFNRLVKDGFDYKAVIFACVPDTENIISAMNYCAENNIFFHKLSASKLEYTAQDWRELLIPSGVHFYTDTGEDVVYVGCGILALHAHDEGEKTLKLPRKVYVTAAWEKGKAVYTDTVTFTAMRFETKLFNIAD